MIGFKYEYLEPDKIIKNINKIINYSSFEILFLIGGIIFMFLLIHFIIPWVNIYLKSIQEEKDKKKKKDLMNKIIMQKDLEDIITKELKEKSSI